MTDYLVKFGKYDPDIPIIPKLNGNCTTLYDSSINGLIEKLNDAQTKLLSSGEAILHPKIRIRENDKWEIYDTKQTRDAIMKIEGRILI